MIVEHALLTVAPGQESAFEAAMSEALEIITAADGCGGAEVRQQLEDPATFLLLVQWETVAAHMEGFRNSEGFQRWRTLTHPFYVSTPVVTHFREPFATR